MQKLEKICPKISLSKSYSPVIFPRCLKHSLISMENKSVDIFKLIPCWTDEMACNALFSASKWREFVTIVSLLLKAPLFTKEVSSLWRVSMPIFCFAESSSTSSFCEIISCFWGIESVSILLAISNKRLFGKRFLMVSISDRKTCLDVENLLESIRKIINWAFSAFS